MLIGGVFIVAGMELVIAAADQLDGTVPIRIVIDRVAGTRDTDGCAWVILDGTERPSRVALTYWCPCRVYVRVSALKRCFILPA